MAGIIVSVLLISAILTIMTVCIKRKHLNRRKTARSDDVSYQVTSRQRVYVKGLEDQGQGQDEPYYASVLTNPALEQGRTTASTEGPYACLEEFQRGTYMTVQKSEEKCSEMEAHYEVVEPVTEVTVLRR
ncbi:uncharacterized protein [Ptychodera flava]|uniref:uncharacterized protein n=1 Tax=Ptychodera flava TaxID=63121 RepID=UPI003969FE1D